MHESEGADYVGSPTCSHVSYLTIVHGQMLASESIEDILAARENAGAPIDIDYTAISHLLHDGFVPQPRTVYKDIYAISIGFSAELGQDEIRFHRSFPFRLSRSKRDQDGSTKALLQHLAAATTAACDERERAVLLLSSGLDSTSLAVAAKHAGRDDLLCVTYGERHESSEVELARSVCRRLGLRHEANVVDVESVQVPRMLMQYATRVPEPCADPAAVASVAAISMSCDHNTVVLDGSGSDFYFWCPPRRLDLLKVQLGPGRFETVRRMRGLLPFYTSHERLLSSPIEPYLLHGAWLRHCDTRMFFPESADTHRFWLNEFRAHADMPDEEARFQARAMYVGPGAHMKKTRNAALSVGAAVRFPWSHRRLAEYCFHLPERCRFDLRARKSKILVRDMLRETIGYDDELVGKRPFLFGKRRFLEAHKAFCREQIHACTLWSRSVERTVDRLARLLTHGRPTENALLALLMVSLWHNHWFTGRLRSAVGEPQRQRAGERSMPSQAVPTPSGSRSAASC